MKCENCEKEHNGSYGSGRFCSSKCARGFSTKSKRQEISKKVSKKLKGKIKKHIFCKSCGNEVYDRKKICDNCKPYFNYKKLFIKFNILDKNVKISNDKCLKILKEEYFINKMSLEDIYKKYKTRYNTIHFYFKRNGIRLRNNSDAATLAYEDGKITPNSNKIYKNGWHTTWDGKQVYLRSSYEFDYAKELDSYKILYEVENKRIRYYDTIKQKDRISIPDFFLVNLNMIVEIKSYYTLNLQNIKDKFSQYKKLGYKTKLIVDYKELTI
jgi:hypothetical protein